MAVDPEQLYNDGLAAFRRGDQAESLRLNEQALQISEAAADELNTVRALVGLGRVAFRDGDYGRVKELAERAMPLFDRLPDKTLVTSPIHMLAESARADGRLDEARTHYERSLELSRATGDRIFEAVEHVNVALLEIAVGNADAAERSARTCLAIEEGRESNLPYALLALGAAAVLRGDARRAVVALTAAHRLVSVAGEMFDPADQPLYDTNIEAARKMLSAEELAEAEGRGRAMSTDEAIALAVGDDGGP